MVLINRPVSAKLTLEWVFRLRSDLISHSIVLFSAVSGRHLWTSLHVFCPVGNSKLAFLSQMKMGTAWVSQQMLQNKPSPRSSSLGFSWQPLAWVSRTPSSMHFLSRYRLKKCLCIGGAGEGGGELYPLMELTVCQGRQRINKGSNICNMWDDNRAKEKERLGVLVWKQTGRRGKRLKPREWAKWALRQMSRAERMAGEGELAWRIGSIAGQQVQLEQTGRWEL